VVVVVGGTVVVGGHAVVDVVVVELDVVLDDVDDDAGVGDTAPGEGASPREAADDPVAAGTADGGSPSPP